MTTMQPRTYQEAAMLGLGDQFLMRQAIENKYGQNPQAPPGIDQAPPPPTNWQETVGPINPNQYLVEQVAQAPTPVQEEPEIVSKGLDPIRNKGLFGVKGTLRDIIGVLGQGLTEGKFNYGDLRRQEQFGNILAGKYENNFEESFVQNPMLAIQRLAEEGYGEEAAKLYQQYQANQIATQKAQLDVTKDARQADNDASLAAQRMAQRQKIAQEVIGRTYASINDEKVLEQFNGWARKYLDDAGLQGVPLARNLKEASRYGINPYQQERLEDFDASIDIQEDRADTYRSVARPRSDTSVELFERYSNIPANKRTPEQQAFVEKFTTAGRGGSKRRTGGGASALPPRPGTFKGQTATSSSGRKFTWDGKKWN